MNYFDASYLVRLYFEDPGWEAVRALAATVHVACCIHGQVEAVAAFHRKLREGALTPNSYRELRKQFDSDCAAGGFYWLPFSERLAARVVTVYAALPPSVHLRAADAVHLVRRLYGASLSNRLGPVNVFAVRKLLGDLLE